MKEEVRCGRVGLLHTKELDDEHGVDGCDGIR